MLEKFLGLRIKGRCFEQEGALEFFPGEKDRVSMVFGRNGSGKSTVSRTFAKIANDGGTLDGMEIVEPITLPSTDPAKQATAITSTDLQPLTRVFNEDYVWDKIKFKDGDSKGLSTIVLLGPQKDLDERIGTLEKRDAIIAKGVEDCTNLKIALEDPNNPEAPVAIWQKMQTILMNQKTLTGWSYRDKSIKRQSKALAVTTEYLTTIIINCKGEDAPDVNLETFNDRISERDRLVKQSGIVLPPITMDTMPTFDENVVLDKLNARIEKSELTDRDKRVVDIVSKLGVNWITDAQKQLDAAETKFCPCCQRPLDPQEKEDVLKSIEAALDKEVKIYIDELNRIRIPAIPQLDSVLSAYEPIAKETVKETRKALGELERIVGLYRKDITERLDDVYGTKAYASHDYSTALDALQDRIKELEAKRQEHERIRERIKDIETELHSLNDKIAKKEIADDFAKGQKQRKVQNENLAKLARHTDFHNRCLKLISDLDAKKKNVHIAANRINAALAYIFMSKNRIRLVPDNGLYKIETNGHSVSPVDISVGERNALAMCYFFSDMLEGNEEKKAYAKEWLVVLDDPVSSFDRENKMGVLSYIMFEIENLTAAQANTRIICLMHELHAYFALAGFINSYNRYYSTDKAEMIPMAVLSLDCREKELINLLQEKPKNPTDKPKPKHLDDINEYCMNFKEIFDYACLDQPKDNIYVGNQARRILEAFSTFVYRKGFEHLFLGRLVTGEMATKYNNYFHDVFSRFAVNDESHLHGHVRSLADANQLYPFLSDTDRQRAVRDTICLLYLIMRDHVRSLLDKDAGERDKQEELIKSWLVNIQESMLTTEEEGTVA